MYFLGHYTQILCIFKSVGNTVTEIILKKTNGHFFTHTLLHSRVGHLQISALYHLPATICSLKSRPPKCHQLFKHWHITILNKNFLIKLGFGTFIKTKLFPAFSSGYFIHLGDLFVGKCQYTYLRQNKSKETMQFFCWCFRIELSLFFLPCSFPDF